MRTKGSRYIENFGFSISRYLFGAVPKLLTHYCNQAS